jgi:hypothetical protein
MGIFLGKARVKTVVVVWLPYIWNEQPNSISADELPYLGFTDTEPVVNLIAAAFSTC